MTTNETPYRPQAGDRVKSLLDTQFDDGYISAVIGARCQVNFRGVWVTVDISELQLISRADGVPVEKVVDLQKENKELRQELDTCRKFIGVVNQSASGMRLLQETATDFEQKRISITFDGAQNVVKLLCSAMKLITHKAANYVELTLDDASGPSFVVTIRKYSGKTPATMQREAEIERDELRKELAEAVRLLYGVKTSIEVMDEILPPMARAMIHGAFIGTEKDIDAFLARHQPPSAVDTQQVNRER